MIDESDIEDIAEEAAAEHLDELFSGIEKDAEEMDIQTTPLGSKLNNE